eukprot:m.166475 g.166475  ORF g.166475 m.166475 type:complete len:242 (+) comp12692_c0_seq1:198-923(+)
MDTAVDRAFDAMCAALSTQGTPSKPTGDSAATAVTATLSAGMAPPTALDYGADTAASYLTRVDAAGPAVHTDDGAVTSQLAHAVQHVAALEGKGGAVPQVEASARAKAAAVKRARKASDNAGSKWFNLPAGSTDENTETTLKLMRLRKYFDPKHFIKSDNRKGNPKYFQIGQVVDGPADHYTADRARGKGKATLADELLNDVAFRQYHKQKFNDIQRHKAREDRPRKRQSAGKNKRRKGRS